MKVIGILICIEASSLLLGAPERCGPVWSERYQGQSNLHYLAPDFLPKIRDFIDALREANASVTITSGFRPDQRQYLMHWSWKIGREFCWRETIAPCDSFFHPDQEVHWYPPAAPVYDGSEAPPEIIWRWRSPPYLPVQIRNCIRNCSCHRWEYWESEAASSALASAFRTVYRPARNSRHCEGRAVDMNISWSGDLEIANRDGVVIKITSSPRDGSNVALHAIGASYGVFKLVSDPPHWSSDGH